MTGDFGDGAFTQSDYQVRLEWGLAGLERLAGGRGGDLLSGAVVVVVDVLEPAPEPAPANSAEVPAPDAGATSESDAARVARAAARFAPVVLLGRLRNASAVARACLAEQERRGARTPFAVIAVGQEETRSRAASPATASGLSSGGIRFAVEDLLGAGAVIAALSDLGLDHTSPEAATACEAFHGLRRATEHMLTSSGTGRVMVAQGLRADVLRAAAVDADETAPRWADSGFVPG